MSEKKIKIITISIVCIMFLLLVILIFQFIKIANLNKTKSNLEKSYNTAQLQIQEYSAETYNILNNENYLQDYAHEILNWTKDGETWYKSK